MICVMILLIPISNFIVDRLGYDVIPPSAVIIARMPNILIICSGSLYAVAASLGLLLFYSIARFCRCSLLSANCTMDLGFLA